MNIGCTQRNNQRPAIINLYRLQTSLAKGHSEVRYLAIKTGAQLVLVYLPVITLPLKMPPMSGIPNLWAAAYNQAMAYSQLGHESGELVCTAPLIQTMDTTALSPTCK